MKAVMKAAARALTGRPVVAARSPADAALHVGVVAGRCCFYDHCPIVASRSSRARVSIAPSIFRDVSGSGMDGCHSLPVRF